MQFDVLTLFPEMFQGPITESLLKKAQQKGLLSFNIVNIRDFASDRHRTADDTPYGGGAGMVMKAEPILAALSQVKRRLESARAERVILMCPAGERLSQEKISALAQQEHLIIICGHYEGLDERIKEAVDEEISIGDYVLTGGEIPAMVLIDAVARQIPGVVKEAESVKKESFFEGLLDYPSYTKPEEYEGRLVPPVLLSGHHAEIERWRRKESLKKTLERRPDLLAQAQLSEKDKELLGDIFLREE